MSLELSAEQMEHINLLLSGLDGSGMHVALADAANRAMQAARTEAWRNVKKEYTVRRTAFYNQTKVTATRAGSADLTAGLSFDGHLIPLYDFNFRENAKGRYLEAEVRTGYREQLKSAYVANLGKYGAAIFQRASPKRDSSEQIMGPAGAEMVANDNVMQNISDRAGEIFVARIEHEVDRILRGY